MTQSSTPYKPCKRAGRVLLTAIAAIAVIFMSSCHKSHEPDPIDPNAVSRTVLVYMAANNSLGSDKYDEMDLDEMDLAVNSDALNGGRLLVFHAPYRSTQTLLEITKEGRKELKTYDSGKSSVSADRMSEVLSDVKRLAAAADYGLVLWSHGSGWIETNKSRSGSESVSPKSWGVDGTAEMKVTTLADVIRQSNLKPSFIYFDACLMGTIEVVYELRDCTKEIVASGTELQVTGMRYDKNVPVFFAKERDMKQAAQNTFDYYNSLPSPNNACSISYILTSELDELADATKAIMRTGLVASDSYRPVAYGSTYYEIYDMPHYIKALGASANLTNAWEEAFRKAVPYFAHTEKYGYLDISKYGGLGTYILRSAKDADQMGYRNYKWWTDVVSTNPTLNP